MKSSHARARRNPNASCHHSGATPPDPLFPFRPLVSSSLCPCSTSRIPLTGLTRLRVQPSRFTIGLIGKLHQFDPQRDRESQHKTSGGLKILPPIFHVNRPFASSLSLSVLTLKTSVRRQSTETSGLNVLPADPAKWVHRMPWLSVLLRVCDPVQLSGRCTGL